MTTADKIQLPEKGQIINYFAHYVFMKTPRYAGPDRIVYALTREAYSTYYRDDRRYFQMETLSKATALIIEESQLNVEFCPHPEAIKVYQLWQQKNEK